VVQANNLQTCGRGGGWIAGLIGDDLSRTWSANARPNGESEKLRFTWQRNDSRIFARLSGTVDREIGARRKDNEEHLE
jgi:hypothetical protein